MESTKPETPTKTVEPRSVEFKLNSAFLESLTIEQHQADVLKENTTLRQELQNLRSELVHQKMENFMLARNITEAKIANSKLEKATDIKNLQNRLLEQARNFLSQHPADSKLNLFESLFSCFSPADRSLIEQARSLDQELIRILSEGLENSLQIEIDKATKAIHDKHHENHAKWIEQFHIGLKIQSYANSLELKLWSHRLISEFRNIVLTLATQDTKIGLLKALKSLESCLEAENV